MSGPVGSAGRLDLSRGEPLDRPVELGAGVGTQRIAALGVGDHLVGDGESPRSGLEAAVEVVLDGRVDLFVEPLEDRRQDVGAVSGARRLPFVAVDPDRPAVVRRQFGVGCFEDPHARAACRVEDHVGPAVVELTGDVAGTRLVRRTVHCCVSALGEVGGDDLDVGVDRDCARFEAGSERLLVSGRFGADEADDAGLGRRRRGDAGQEPGLFVRPGVRRDVGDVVEVSTAVVGQHVPLVRVEHRLPHRARSVADRGSRGRSRQRPARFRASPVRAGRVGPPRGRSPVRRGRDPARTAPRPGCRPDRPRRRPRSAGSRRKGRRRRPRRSRRS